MEWITPGGKVDWVEIVTDISIIVLVLAIVVNLYD